MRTPLRCPLRPLQTQTNRHQSRSRRRTRCRSRHGKRKQPSRQRNMQSPPDPSTRQPAHTSPSIRSRRRRDLGHTTACAMPRAYRPNFRTRPLYVLRDARGDGSVRLVRRVEAIAAARSAPEHGEQLLVISRADRLISRQDPGRDSRLPEVRRRSTAPMRRTRRKLLLDETLA
jgi:hypothetical protein